MQKIYFTLLFCLQFVAAQTSLAQVAMLVPDNNSGAPLSADEQAAVVWFEKTYVDKGVGKILTPSGMSDANALNANDYPACWVMCDRVGINKGYSNLPGNLASATTINVLKAFCADGGNLLLTNHATQLAVAVGRIDSKYAPNLLASDQDENVKGVQPIIGNVVGQKYNHLNHYIYKGLTSESVDNHSIYLLSPTADNDNCMWDLNATDYGLADSPNKVKDWENKTGSTVLGTWDHVTDYCCAGIVDFNPTTTFAGRILAVGLSSYNWRKKTEGDAISNNVKTFTSNLLDYISKPATSKVAMLIPDDYATAGNVAADEKAAVDWFKKTYVDKGVGVLLTPSDMGSLSAVNNPVCWVACSRIGIERGWDNLPGGLALDGTVNALKNYCKDGGNLFFTNHATQLTVAIGRIDEDHAPNQFVSSSDTKAVSDIWGVQPIIGKEGGEVYDHSKHEIYWGINFVNGYYGYAIYPLNGSEMRNDHNCLWEFAKDINGVYEQQYDDINGPNYVKSWEEKTNSEVLGTWNHTLDYTVAAVVDFKPTDEYKGHILTVGLGAYEWCSDIEGTEIDNPYKGQLELFTENCLNYLDPSGKLYIGGSALYESGSNFGENYFAPTYRKPMMKRENLGEPHYVYTGFFKRGETFAFFPSKEAYTNNCSEDADYAAVDANEGTRWTTQAPVDGEGKATGGDYPYFNKVVWNTGVMEESLGTGRAITWQLPDGNYTVRFYYSGDILAPAESDEALYTVDKEVTLVNVTSDFAEMENGDSGHNYGGWYPFSDDCSLSLPDGIKAFYVSRIDNGKAVLTEVENNTIPANFGVLLYDKNLDRKGATETIHLRPLKSGYTTGSANVNLLKNCAKHDPKTKVQPVETDGNGQKRYNYFFTPRYYISGVLTEVPLNLWKAVANAKVPKNGTYLSVSTEILPVAFDGKDMNYKYETDPDAVASNARSYCFPLSFEGFDETIITGIVSVDDDKKPDTSDVWYTIQGIRIGKPSLSGIYIHNGKKMIIK